MLRRIVYLTVMLAAFGSAAAQEGKPGMDSTRKARLEELKKTRKELFIKKLELTTEEANKFFPVYDEYQQKLRQARKAFKDKWKGKKPEELSEEEASVYLNDAVELRTKELELFKTYSDKLKTVIPVKKVILIPKVEKEIHRELISKARDGKGHGKRPGPGKNGKPRNGDGPPPPPPDEGQ